MQRTIRSQLNRGRVAAVPAEGLWHGAGRGTYKACQEIRDLLEIFSRKGTGVSGGSCVSIVGTPLPGL